VDASGGHKKTTPFLSVPGGDVYLASPWTDREDLRYLLKNCTATMTESACDMTVTGSVEQGSMGGPQLTDVKFTASR
jgi:hypothetical protein